MTEAKSLEPTLRETNVTGGSSTGKEVREIRMTLRLSPEAREALEWIAESRNVTLAEAIRRALGTERFLIQMEKRKARIFVEQPGERTKELILV